METVHAMTGLSIELMTEDFVRDHFLMWRCLHDGPLSKESIDAWKPDSHMPWTELRARNLPLLSKIIATYGACAVAALDGERVAGQLWFYPKALWQMANGGMLCMQQFPPEGPDAQFAGSDFPPKEQLAEKTLVVHCLMTGCPTLPEQPYWRRGIGSGMVKKLVEWAGENGWKAVEATAYEELEILYQVTGQAGKRFWEKLGFRAVETGVEKAFFSYEGIFAAMQAEAARKGLDLETITAKYTMRRELGA